MTLGDIKTVLGNSGRNGKEDLTNTVNVPTQGVLEVHYLTLMTLLVLAHADLVALLSQLCRLLIKKTGCLLLSRLANQSGATGKLPAVYLIPC